MSRRDIGAKDPGASDAVTVRDAVPADRDALLAMTAALQDHERQINANRRPGTDMADSHLALLERLVARHEGRLLVAEADGRPVGMLVCFVDEAESYIVASDRRFGYVSDLFVTPQTRGRGVGRRLLAEAERHFRALGLVQIQIGTLANNTAARAAYEAWGFRPYELTLEKRLAAPRDESAGRGRRRAGVRS